uniref:AT-rich interactive domain-containing protein 2 n=1 Tax=Anthurium amnicola TaxID=1678845 RepID=A0A1D1Y255_9ARAE
MLPVVCFVALPAAGPGRERQREEPIMGSMEEPRMVEEPRTGSMEEPPTMGKQPGTAWVRPHTPLSLDVPGILHNLHSVGFRPELEHILSVLFKEASPEGKGMRPRPFPVALGDGRPVDLFRLYVAVREKGGYQSVTATGSWAFVAEAVGLDAAVRPALKLIYVKYLAGLDRWLQQVLLKGREEAVGRKPNLGSLLHKLGADDMGSSRGSGELLPFASEEQPCSPLKGSGMERQGENDRAHDEVVVLDPVGGRHQRSSPRRKRGSLADVLGFVKRVSKSPGHPPLGNAPNGKDEELFSLALLARNAMFAKLFRTTVPQKRQRVLPCMYDEYTNSESQTNKHLRCSQRIRSRSCSDSSTVLDYDSDDNFIDSTTECSSDRERSRQSSLSHIAGLSAKGWQCTRVGPAYQAKIPECLGKVSLTSNDLNVRKYLGTQIWLPETNECKVLMEQEPNGSGKVREATCCCEHRGSIECVRLHVGETRSLLKYELGTAFCGLGFNNMGEEVSLSWKEEEEQKFKAAVHLNAPSLNRSFWDWVFMCFPSKTRQSLVSYYFNVFILRRRSYQNRVTPKEIHSDDDESVIGLSNSFGRDTVKVQTS